MQERHHQPSGHAAGVAKYHTYKIAVMKVMKLTFKFPHKQYLLLRLYHMTQSNRCY